MITRAEAIDMYNSNDLIGIGMEADAVRRKLHPEGVVSYIIDRNINYTNTCTEYCSFCAFYRPLGHKEGYLHPKEVIFSKIQETLDLGGTGILMQGGLHPELKIEWYEDLLRSIKANFNIWCHCFSAPEIVNIAKVSDITIRETLARLRDAGLDSLPGGGAEIFDERVRRIICDHKIDGAEWLETARIAHQLGLHSNCTMLYGHIENEEARVDHLIKLRELQDETNGFVTFIPLAFHPENTALDHLPKTTGFDDLKMIAVSRLMLDNMPHIKAYWIMMTPRIAQIALRFGADDIDGTVVEEKIYHDAGATTSQSMRRQELLALIRKAGREPMERDTLYRPVERTESAFTILV